MSNTATLDREEQAQIDAIRARKAKEREHQGKVDQLKKSVTDAEASLIELESKTQFLQTRKQQLKDQLLRLWPTQPSDVSLQPGSSPLQLVVESWGTIGAIDSAISDVPRVRKYLEQQLSAAKTRLAQFHGQK